MTEQELRAVSEGDVSGLSDADAAAMAYAVAMTQARVDVDDALFARMRTHWRAEQIVELTAAIAWENYRARFNHALGMQSEGFSEGAFCALPAANPGSIAQSTPA